MDDLVKIEDDFEIPENSKPKDEKKESAKIDDSTLIDVHIRNPLKRITELLEDIKKQKAFTFTFKGSLGIMGVVLVFSMVGLFGTTHALCDKGIQSQVGTIKALNADDIEEESIITRLKRINEYFTALTTGKKIEERNEKRIVLISNDLNTMHIIRGRDVSLVPFRNQGVIITGPYNECSRSLKVENQNQIETI